MATQNGVSTFPRIARFTGTSDSPGDTCPHCGATGRYIVHFRTVDGRTGGAMRGCIKLFPVSEVAREDLRLQDKAAKYDKQGWNLNRADIHARDMIEKFFAGEVSEAIAMSAVNSAKAQTAARYRRR